MSILFGHPSGNPFAHQAALAHYQAGWLESFCVPWMPSPAVLRLMAQAPPLRPMAARLGRRYFAPLAAAPKTQSRIAEWLRLARRVGGGDEDAVALDANEWLMRTMAGLADIPRVSAVHAYEDCSLWQFRRARQRGKACIYDMPIGYYAAWEVLREKLAGKYSDWLPPAMPLQLMSREQKREEMQLADLVLAPSAFVGGTIRNAGVDKPIAVVPFGIDAAGWAVSRDHAPRRELTFLFAGQCSVRKGVPLLLEAWRAAALADARLELVGPWRLAEAKKRALPPGCSWRGPVASAQLRDIYAGADIFVFPTNFEGRALVIGEALASGLPVLTTKASGMDDAVDESCGRLVAAENLDDWVESLRWVADNRDRLPTLQRAARAKAEGLGWDGYRARLIDAVRPFAAARAS